MRAALILAASAVAIAAPVPAAPVPTAPVPTAPVPTAPVPTAPVPAAPVPAAPVPAVPAPSNATAPVPSNATAPVPVPVPAQAPAAVQTQINTLVAATFGNGTGTNTINATAWNQLINTVNANPGPASTAMLLTSLRSANSGFVYNAQCGNCVENLNVFGGLTGCLRSCSATGTRRAANDATILTCGAGTAVQQAKCLYDAACAGVITSNDVCVINGATVNCPSCGSRSKKGLLGLLGLIGIVPLVLSCSLLFLLCRGKKQPVPVATFVPVEQSTCMPMPMHCDAGLTFNNTCAPTAFGFGQTPVML